MGHLPVLGESLALPLIREAGSKRVGDTVFDEIFHPISRMLARTGGRRFTSGRPVEGRR